MSTLCIKPGTVVKVWRNGKGKDYFVVGISRDKTKLMMLNNNCVNEDGTVLSGVLKVHMQAGIIHKDGSRVCQKITRVVGTRVVNQRAIKSWLRSSGHLDVVNMRASDRVYIGSHAIDSRLATEL